MGRICAHLRRSMFHHLWISPTDDTLTITVGKICRQSMLSVCRTWKLFTSPASIMEAWPLWKWSDLRTTRKKLPLVMVGLSFAVPWDGGLLSRKLGAERSPLFQHRHCRCNRRRADHRLCKVSLKIILEHQIMTSLPHTMSTLLILTQPEIDEILMIISLTWTDTSKWDQLGETSCSCDVKPKGFLFLSSTRLKVLLNFSLLWIMPWVLAVWVMSTKPGNIQ